MVDTMTEIELKYRIDGQDGLRRLLSGLPQPSASFIQTNNYLDDTARSLRKAAIMLRARETESPSEGPPSSRLATVAFQAKCRISKEDGLFISEEREQVIPLEAWNAHKKRGLSIPTDGPLFQWLRSVAPFGSLEVIGHTVNYRSEIHSDLFVLELDRTIFPDGSEELELECETTAPGAARAHIEGLFERLGVRAGPQLEGKYARFLSKTGL